MAAWVQVAAAAEVPSGEKIAVSVAGEDIAIFNVDGTLYAIGDVCTHAEASLVEGEFYDEIVECPLHGSAFDVTTGKALSLPALGNVGKYAVKVEDGAIFVDPAPITPRATR